MIDRTTLNAILYDGTTLNAILYDRTTLNAILNYGLRLCALTKCPSQDYIYPRFKCTSLTSRWEGHYKTKHKIRFRPNSPTIEDSGQAVGPGGSAVLKDLMHFKCTVLHTASFPQTHLFWFLHRTRNVPFAAALPRSRTPHESLDRNVQGVISHVAVAEQLPIAESTGDLSGTTARTAAEDVYLGGTTARTVAEDAHLSGTTARTAAEDVYLGGTTARTVAEDAHLSGTTARTAAEDADLGGTTARTAAEDAGISAIGLPQRMRISAEQLLGLPDLGGATARTVALGNKKTCVDCGSPCVRVRGNNG